MIHSWFDLQFHESKTPEKVKNLGSFKLYILGRVVDSLF